MTGVTKTKRYKGSIRAVLTGDLVGSSELTVGSLEAARATLLEALAEIGLWQDDLVGSQPEFFRGDSWQALLMDPHYCLRSFVYIRAKLRGTTKVWDSRIAIGLGAVARIDKQRTSLSTGEAFNCSGRALDGLATGKIALASPNDLAGRLSGLHALAHICSGLVDDWSQTQAQISCLALAPKPPTQGEIAERLGVSQQSVSKTLAAAKLALIMQAVDYCERFAWGNLQRFI